MDHPILSPVTQFQGRITVHQLQREGGDSIFGFPGVDRVPPDMSPGPTLTLTPCIVREGGEVANGAFPVQTCAMMRRPFQ